MENFEIYKQIKALPVICVTDLCHIFHCGSQRLNEVIISGRQQLQRTTLILCAHKK